MSRNNKNEQISGVFGTINDLRQELESKIANKVSSNTFWGVLTLLVSVSIACTGYLVYCKDKQEDKINSLVADVAVLKDQKNYQK